MAYLVDTSVLARLANAGDRFHAVAIRAVFELHRRGEVLHMTPQNLIEFRSVATRPVTSNGLGMTCGEADLTSARFESVFPLLPDTPDIFPEWKTLVETLEVVGKQVHDARLTAVCHVHEMTHLLTFNTQHFLRLAAIEPHISVIDPASI